jgi:hypothetical protein
LFVSIRFFFSVKSFYSVSNISHSYQLVPILVNWFIEIELIGSKTPLLARGSKTPLPALENLGELTHADAFGAVDRARIFLDDSAPTALERADGNWGPAVWRLGGQHASAHVTLATLAAFDAHLAPSCRQPRTRADCWPTWRLVVTWAVARKAVHGILPKSLETLKALTWDLVAVPSLQIELVWKSVQARHRQFQLRQPLCKANQYASSRCWARCAAGQWR